MIQSNIVYNIMTNDILSYHFDNDSILLIYHIIRYCIDKCDIVSYNMKHYHII